MNLSGAMWASPPTIINISYVGGCRIKDNLHKSVPPSDEGDSPQCGEMSRSDRGDRRSQRVARLCRDGGRENALIKPFLTTPQSPTVTAPLTRGAETGFFDRLK